MNQTPIFRVILVLMFLTNGAIAAEPKTEVNKNKEQNSSEWKLVWEENFDKDDKIDDTVWSKIPRGSSDWNRHMSDYDKLYDVKDGNLILRGMVNPGLPGDTAPFITGGVYTKNKKGFEHGKIEIKAKLGNAKGAWPAFWLLPFDNERWPRGGEIDIMERLNSDEIAYQTVHSHYTVNLKQTKPKKGATGSILKDQYNVYAVELYPDKLVFRINDKHTFTYPRIETDLEGQFPFDRPFYLMLDMQLGGKWVGEVEPKDLPVEMYIDWVRFYQKEGERKEE
ncbi:MAG: glycoside hydrolase family 16 protein [Planctomycetaceae bacterium]|jgi:beta-glucanase (GH16 family)|nr:glycoside hydrolase family 16 protein [Planctomycetaceae bacterium]